MTILGIDTAATTCSAAIVSDRKVLSCASRNDGLTHSQTLLPMVKEVLEHAKLSVSDLDGIGVSCGPGSFTGLRIGISTVKGLSMGCGCGCVPVSTLEALAWNCRDREGCLVCPVMDARRGEFYQALFRVRGGIPERVTEDRAVPGETVADGIRGETDLIVLGDGAEKFCAAFPEFGDRLADLDLRFQSGVSVALLAEKLASEQGFVSCDSLTPRYLRLPQAEREWNRKHHNQ